MNTETFCVNEERNLVFHRCKRTGKKNILGGIFCTGRDKDNFFFSVDGVLIDFRIGVYPLDYKFHMVSDVLKPLKKRG